MDSFDFYMTNHVCVSDRKNSAACLLCPAAVSSVRDDELPAKLHQHFDKHHKQKVGCLYCTVCYKSVCNIGQKQQLDIHQKHSAHMAKLSRVGSSFRFCKTCGACNPTLEHNPNHKIFEKTFSKMDEDAEIVHAGELNKSDLEDLILSHLTVRKGNEVSIGAWCNEHFERTFRCDHAHTPIPSRVVKDAACKVCTSLHRMWPEVEVRPGQLLYFPEKAFRALLVKDIKHEPEYEQTITVVEYSELDDSLQDLYTFDPQTKSFKLVRSAAKKDAVKKFLTGVEKPASSLSEDVVDGTADSEKEEDEAFVLADDEQELGN